MTNSGIDNTIWKAVPVPDSIWDKAEFIAISPGGWGAVVQSMRIPSRASRFTKLRQRDVSLSINTFCKHRKSTTPTSIR